MCFPIGVFRSLYMSIFQGKLPLPGITITRLEDSDTYKNAFEISGPMIEKIIAICQSKEEASNWVDLLRKHTKGHHKTPPPTSPGDSVPTPPPHVSSIIFSSKLEKFGRPLHFLFTSLIVVVTRYVLL